jgi:DNA invertase Pin-like site-specific DNA recombinase
MPSAKSFYHRRPGRFAKERKEVQRLVEEIKRTTLEHGYTKNEIADMLGVNVQSVRVWFWGRSSMTRRDIVERLKKFVSAHA